MGHGEHEGSPITVAVITVSDTRTESTDRSGALIRELCSAAGHCVTQYRIIPDEPDEVRKAVAAFATSPDVHAVLLSGGTGISTRDRTFEAIAALFDRRLDGFGELFRMLSYQEIGPRAMLSRAAAGLVSGRPVFSMPGSTGAVRLAMEKLILPALPHVVAEAQRQS